MSVTTPAEQTFKANLMKLFSAAKDTLPLPASFYDDLTDVLREGMEGYVAESMTITDDEQRDVLYEGMSEFLDDFIPDLVASIRESTNAMLVSGKEDYAFSEARVDSIVLTETRHARLPMQLMTDLIQRRWDEGEA
jgi:hypothetical protein